MTPSDGPAPGATPSKRALRPSLSVMSSHRPSRLNTRPTAAFGASSTPGTSDKVPVRRSCTATSDGPPGCPGSYRGSGPGRESWNAAYRPFALRTTSEARARPGGSGKLRAAAPTRVLAQAADVGGVGAGHGGDVAAAVGRLLPLRMMLPRKSWPVAAAAWRRRSYVVSPLRRVAVTAPFTTSRVVRITPALARVLDAKHIPSARATRSRIRSTVSSVSMLTS